jgi:hypothetical protein
MHFELYVFGNFLTYLLFIVNYIYMNFFLYSRLPNKCFATKYKSFKNSQFVLAVIVNIIVFTAKHRKKSFLMLKLFLIKLTQIVKILKESQVIGLILRKNDKKGIIRNMITLETDNFIVDTLHLRITIWEPQAITALCTQLLVTFLIVRGSTHSTIYLIIFRT